MANIENLGYTLDDLEKARQERSSAWATDSPFKWKSEYLPIIVVGLGIVATPFIIKIIKKRK